MSLKDAFLRTRQAALDIAVERARPKTWKAGRVTQDGVTTVTTDPVAADTPDGTHAELLEAHGFDPARYRIVGPIRSTRWTAYLPKEYRTNSVPGEPVEDAFTFQAKASRFQVVERAEGELSIDELIAAVEAFTPTERSGRVNVASSDAQVIAAGERNTSADGTNGACHVVPPAEFMQPGEAYVVACADAQAGKLESPTEELIGRLLDYMHKAVEPLQGRKVEHIHLAWLGDACEGMNSQGGSLRWRTTLTMTEQVRLIRRLMLKQIEILAPYAERLTVVSVGGNHDEGYSRDLKTREDDSWAVEALNMVSDALEFNPAFSHVECYVPGPDEQGVVMDVAGTVIAHVHGHKIKPGKWREWWAGQALGRQSYGEADLLLQGHMHHMQFAEDGDRKWLCVPALEETSKWWEHKTGTHGSPGILTFKTKDGRIRDMTKIETTRDA